MSGPSRIGAGLWTRPDEPVEFRFDGQALRGLRGDTLASALLANGVQLVGRSFKYHRPRGIVTAGPEEPCALVDVLGPDGREPNRPATTLPLREGLITESQNRWPSLHFDVGSLGNLVARFLPAGFYYKTFMAPGWAWERLYEPAIRRAAGLGRLGLTATDHPSPAETVHDHADVLIVGAGAAGLAAAHGLGRTGARVMLLEQDAAPGGGTLLDRRWQAWQQGLSAALAGLHNVRCLPRSCVVGAYGHGVYAALETLSPEESIAFGGIRERLRIIRARRLLLTTGAIERLIAFPGNDVPGVMLAGAALAYLRRYGVAAGGHPAFFLNSDEAYQTVFEFAAAGIACAGVIDVRPESRAADHARSLGIRVQCGAMVERVEGARSVRRLRIASLAGGATALEADALLMSGGYSPASALASQLGAKHLWQESIAAFAPLLDPHIGRVAGAARGRCGLKVAALDGAAAAESIAAELGFAAGAVSPAWELPADAEQTPLTPLWEVRGRGKAFVDLQNDVTTADVRLAHREGYEHVEHMKRYTTHGMATDQGRIGGLVGSAVLAQARGLPVSEVGLAKIRPYVQPLPFAALAGPETGQHFKPRRRLPLHDWHEAAGASFVSIGLWLRPLVYARETGWDAVLREARAVRRSVGITDVSSLGKIDVQGPDAARFLDYIYANNFATLPVGRARYGIMLREDGMMLDDGTTSRLGAEHFLITTTTANSSVVLEHMEFQLQAVCPHHDVLLSDVSDQWAQFAIAGPRSREVVASVASGLDLSNAAFPFMAASAALLAGVAGRVFRISFSGELAFELAVPAAHALRLWTALLAAGQAFGIAPYGLDALNTLRIEKGHLTGAELNGNTTADDLGMERMLKSKGDFVGRMLAQRPGLRSPERLQLVGVRPIDRSQRLRNGAQLIVPEAPSRSLGYITSSTPSVELEGWVGLALLAGGRERMGKHLIATSPIHGETTTVAILSPHMIDPENSRVRA
ncbi:MAG TPA: 2Fe-2S iron-sulfur cluster-binding protein [Steroidobacteraceae bacterium]|nr:2Fe-2S iron-sulfur cluster-binding protein [Steroidobacteraceae bacterium]